MNLSRRQLLQFVAAATQPSLSRAAELCNLSQRAFSRSLQGLEQGLGTRLFEHSTRHLALTPDGMRLLPLARRLLDDLDELAREARALRGVEVTSLALQLSLVAAGVCTSIVSALGASSPLARGLHFVPLRPRLERHVQLLHRKDRPLRPAAAALARAVHQAVATARLHPAVRRAPLAAGEPRRA